MKKKETIHSHEARPRQSPGTPRQSSGTPRESPGKPRESPREASVAQGGAEEASWRPRQRESVGWGPQVKQKPHKK